MIEMSHTEEDNLFTTDEKQLTINDVSRKCNTALEILQNEVINCEKSISLEKSQRELNERKVECDEQLKKNSSQVTTVHTSNNECTGSIENTSSTIFNNDQFSELIENIMRVGSHFNGIEEDDVQKIIFEYAELNEIDHGFDKTLRKTENEWYQRFMQSHPNLNSVIRKPQSDSVQLHETDIEFSSRIVDKFVSDYKNSKRNALNTEQSLGYKRVDVVSTTDQLLETSMSYQKSEETWSECNKNSTCSVVNNFESINQNELESFPTEKNGAMTEIATENSASRMKGVCSSSFADTSEFVANNELHDSASSACPNNSHFANECSTKGSHPDCYENTSNEELNVSFTNIEAKNSDDGDRSEIVIRDSNKISLEKSYSAAMSTEAGTIQTKTSENSNDVIFPENPGSVSNLETWDLKRDTTESVENSSSLTNDDTYSDMCGKNSTEFSTSNGEASEDVNLEKTCSNARSPSAQPMSEQKEANSSTRPEEDGAAQENSKILKRKRPLNRKTKKSKKYVYKLKSYNTVSVFQFTSSTPYSFMKPVIKLTKLDESSFKNSESGITSPSGTGIEQEANIVDEVVTNSSNDFEDEGEVTTDSKVATVTEPEVEAQLNSDSNDDSKDVADAESDSNTEYYSKNEVESETNCNADHDSKDEVEAKTNSNCDKELEKEAETGPSLSCTSDLENEAEVNCSVDPVNVSEESKVETGTVVDSDEDSKNDVEAKISANPGNDDSKDDIKAEINSDVGNDSKCQKAKSLKTTVERNLNKSAVNQGGTPTLKANTTNENTTPTFGMQTRRKRLKFLPDGTLVTPNQRLSHFLEDLSSSSRSESKSAKKRSLKTPPQDTPRPEKKMKIGSASSTPKQSTRPTPPSKKASRNRPDRYIPEPNGKSKKPQKIFDYEGYYRENFRQTEVKLPPSCKKQMVALSRVTSISPAAQSGGQYSVNPAQLLSCLLGMPVTPDQIRTVRFKPPVKQLKSYKESDSTPSKLASSDATKPTVKRHSETLQKKPFNNASKTEVDATKPTAVTKSKPAT